MPTGRNAAPPLYPSTNTVPHDVSEAPREGPRVAESVQHASKREQQCRNAGHLLPAARQEAHAAESDEDREPLACFVAEAAECSFAHL